MLDPRRANFHKRRAVDGTLSWSRRSCVGGRIDDHLVHINVLLNRIQQLEQMGGGLPKAQQLYAQHLEQHLQYLGLRDKNMERALRKKIRDLAKQKEAELMQGSSTTMGAM